MPSMLGAIHPQNEEIVSLAKIWMIQGHYVTWNNRQFPVISLTNGIYSSSMAMARDKGGGRQEKGGGFQGFAGTVTVKEHCAVNLGIGEL